MASSILLFLLQSGIAGAVALLSFFGLAPTKLGEKFLGYHLDQRLAAVQHAQNQQIEELRAKLANLGDRVVRANAQEFKALTEVWEGFVDAYDAAYRCVLAFVSHPDLSQFSPEELAEFLESTQLSDLQKRRVTATETRDRNTAYAKAVNQSQAWEAGKAIYEARALLRKRGIFLLDEVTTEFETKLNILSEAQIHKQMSLHFAPREEKAVERLITEGPKLFADMRRTVRTRVFAG